MKAIEFKVYGPPEVLRLADVDKPIPKADEVMVRVHAASINSWDLDLLRGDFVNRIQFGIRRPKIKTLGADVAGRVEAVGPNASRFKPGDEVWGDLCYSGWGGFAEYVCAPQKDFALKPTGISFAEAAAVPQAALLALQGLRCAPPIKPGQKILINGAGGGFGTFALQMAKAAGAEITAVDSALKLPMLAAMGADHVIDYALEDFTKTGRGYDLILDAVTNRPVTDYVRALNSQGSYITVGGKLTRLFQCFASGPWIRKVHHKHVQVVAYKPNQGLDDLKALMEEGKLRSVVDGPFKLGDVADAFWHCKNGRHFGKVVIAID